MKVKCHVRPGSRKNEIEYLSDTEWRVKIKSLPIEGKANEELIRFLAEHLGIPKSYITIRSGQKGRIKYIEIMDK